MWFLTYSWICIKQVSILKRKKLQNQEISSEMLIERSLSNHAIFWCNLQSLYFFDKIRFFPVVIIMNLLTNERCNATATHIPKLDCTVAVGVRSKKWTTSATNVPRCAVGYGLNRPGAMYTYIHTCQLFRFHVFFTHTPAGLDSPADLLISWWHRQRRSVWYMCRGIWSQRWTPLPVPDVCHSSLHSLKPSSPLSLPL